MIAILVLLQVAAGSPESCQLVRRDHEKFKSWAMSSLKQFEGAKNGRPSSADRARWDVYEKSVEAGITDLNRRYAECREE